MGVWGATGNPNVSAKSPRPQLTYISSQTRISLLKSSKLNSSHLLLRCL